VTAFEIDEIAGVPGFCDALASVGWITITEEGAFFPNFGEHNTTGKERSSRAKSGAERQREYRERQRQKAVKPAQEFTPLTTLAPSQSNGFCDDSLRHDDVTVMSYSNRREDKRREDVNKKEPSVLVATALPEGEIEKIEKCEMPQPLKNASEAQSGSYKPPPCPNHEILALYHLHLPTLARVEVMSDARRRSLVARWREVCADGKFTREEALEWFDRYFKHASESKFLLGQTHQSGRIWRADFDFLLSPSKFIRVVEGYYHNERKAA
jgi:hypothetical protein